MKLQKGLKLMLDCFNREINYLRVSVTDRCNLRCTYCMPADGVPMLTHTDILSFDEIADVVRYGAGQGITKVRITGGEPLVRKGIVNLVSILSKINGIKELTMTSNGILLPVFAKELKAAGLHRINISLDTMNAERFAATTRGGNLNDVIAGVDAAIEADLTPVKLNCVIKNSPEDPDAISVKEFAVSRGIEVRYIHLMDLHLGEFSKVIGGDGGNCASCNRLRLTANGNLIPCLFSNLEYNVRKLGLEKAFEMALGNKPVSGTTSNTHGFYNTGG
ncbi:MAG TPA: radical SAM protein [Bacteroidales bacterium]|nr:radical SAM protein [Bacteroidales bacterium]HCB62971.1 radical SAM protein [Bacteroidales bacterium]HCY24265.1 radical SAM protein [Bacteroidales bacterium]